MKKYNYKQVQRRAYKKGYYVRPTMTTKNYKEYKEGFKWVMFPNRIVSQDDFIYFNRLYDAMEIFDEMDRKREEEAMDLKERLLEEEKEQKAIIEQDFLDYVFEDEFLKEVFDDEKYL